MVGNQLVREIVTRALNEDIGKGDITTESIFNRHHNSRGQIVCKEKGVIAGLNIARMVFSMVYPGVKLIGKFNEGDRIDDPPKILAEVEGPTLGMLQGERVALNFLARLSGIATVTRRFVDKVKDFPVMITDTRKTTPGLRLLEKYAVTVGGGVNHRFGLYDTPMIKDNHIRAAGGIKNAVEKVRQRIPFTVKIEVEASNLEEVEESLAVKVDIIMLDNMSLEDMKEAVKIIDGRALTEASGGINLNNVRSIAATGVDFISVGALTHKVKSLDISLDL
ncbi:MAG: carboxylating nicotinate-nucleotide diphosphorylase [Candidatus Syntrophonatronum acetioxidans]|uniref:Probable nicotinate-nucleotide pyrophosphorylase [carboxylating] n=1 Tax=Candidatus Syntrophonatronum acetioxidans TaxID=1795816 RepID=A0A424YDK0_9FIRM|nr:MAG: carboxylating nicotinate-nucleotide diphosphorylase [Candidatus Syntrophonatronum acetioxidans]